MAMDEFVTAGEQPVYSEAEPTVVTGEDGSSLEVRCASGGPRFGSCQAVGSLGWVLSSRATRLW
jgi:hypothetical protein